MSLKPAFFSKSLTDNTRRVLCSVESKVFFMIIPVSSKRQQKQCQDQFVNKNKVPSITLIFVLFLWTNTLKHA